MSTVYGSQNSTNINPNPTLGAQGNPSAPLTADGALLAEAGLPVGDVSLPEPVSAGVEVQGVTVSMTSK